MSFTDQSIRPDPRTPEDEADPDRCVHCTTPMLEDQEWCLECGAARTLIHGPPDWRVPVAVIGTVVALAVAAFALVLINLSNNADHSVNVQTVVAGGTARTAKRHHAPARSTATGAETTSASTTATTGTTTPTTPTSSTPVAATPPGIATWPVGLSGWTVVLARYPDQATANATAERVKAEGLPVGVLFTSDHPSMKPGGWVVFTGRYPDHAKARAAAVRLHAAGHTARARQVAPPGGR